MGHRTSTASLMVIGLLACAYSDDSSSPPPPTPDDFDQYYVGAWELTSVNDSFEGPDRPATADEARTWHVFPSEAYDAGSYRSPVTVDWGGAAPAADTGISICWCAWRSVYPLKLADPNPTSVGLTPRGMV